jgi:hypothetical protein
MRKVLLLSILISLSLLTATFSAAAEGLSYLSKDTIAKRTNPDFRDFIRQYLNFSDSYSSKECVDYGSRANARKECQQYCEMYFKENYGLMPLAASYLRTKAAVMEYSPDLRNVLYSFLIQGKKYDTQDCNRAWQEWVNTRYKDKDQRLKDLLYKQSENMCQTFFQP